MGFGRRQLATVLFCDVVGSTALGEAADAEIVRELMFRYFHEMRAVIEGHGGTVEKFIGDAVEAVFGVPAVHEDDPLRAVRAAWEMQQLMPALNEEFERRFGTRIALRIGVSTGEVVTGEATGRETIVTGDMVNVAARLEQAAGPGEILIGAQTYLLARDAIRAEPVAPLGLKGKSEPVPAHRLVGVEAGARGRSPRFVTPLIGREPELAALTAAGERALAGQGGWIVLAGVAGIGKSRLAAEFLDGIEATVLSGCCPPYGGGLTFWPLAEAVRQATGIRHEDSQARARAKLAELLEGEDRAALVTMRLGQALGLAGGAAPAEEIGWALRRVFAVLARRRPLVLVLDDLHWAEPALLDLVEQIAAEATGLPLLVLCLGRPALLDARPGWSEAVLLLEPLARAASIQLLSGLLGADALAGERSARVVDAAGGNPLYLEELVALRHDDFETAIPPTLELLLAARLEQLAPEERQAAERGAVEGEVFHRGAVVELSQPRVRPGVASALRRLCDSELVETAPAAFTGEAAFRFRHILIRDAAYRATLKSLRAELHERFADWLERIAGERLAEHEEILGYHLEQAFRYREQLGPVELYRRLAARAASHLGNAGLRASGRGDAGAAVAVLERALLLLGEDAPSRPELLLALGEACWSRFDSERASSALEAAAAAAAAAGRRELEGIARLALANIGMHMNRGRGEEELRLTAEEWLPRLEEVGDERALAKAWLARGVAEAVGLRFAAASAMFERALDYARQAGATMDELEGAFWFSLSILVGPTPVEEGIERLAREAEQATTLAAKATLLERIGMLNACAGRFAQAHALIDQAGAIYEELGLDYQLGYLRGFTESELAELVGEVDAAERAYRQGCERLEAIGETGALSTLEARLASLLCDRGRYDEAETLAIHSDTIGDPGDLITQVGRRNAHARALANRGELKVAETLAREAVTIAAQGDAVRERACSLQALADVLGLSGRGEEAAQAEQDALAIYERKGNRPMAVRARARLDALRATAG